MKKWVYAAVALVVLVLVMGGASANGMVSCPGSQVHCPGVGCVSGWDKCTAGAKGGSSAVFSREAFDNWPGAGKRSEPPNYGDVKEKFTEAGAPRSMSSCPGGYRSDGPCLMEF